MPDYGHELAVRHLPQPGRRPRRADLELAQLADVTGLDLVSVQDHPYQGRHLDTWTLLSVIAARTSAVRVAPNVANLPLRHPVVLARSAATLDLLSGGRVELGLGAGAFWDGDRRARRTPSLRRGEAVDALVEAIGVIRASWAGGTHPPRRRALPRARRPRRARGRRTTSRSGWGVQAADAPGDRRPRRCAGSRRWATPTPPTSPTMNAVIDERTEAERPRVQAVRRMYNVFGRFGSGRRLPAGLGRPTGPSSSPGSRRRGHQHLRARHRRRRRRTPLRPRGGARRARAGRGRARPARRREDRSPRKDEVDRRSEHGRSPVSKRRPPAVTPTPPPPLITATVPWDESTRPTYPTPPDAQLHRGRAGLAAAPHRRPRRPARRARPAARRRRAGAPRADPGRPGALGHQHDDDAAEQLDAGHLLRDLLPHRHRPPHARGPQHVPAAARAATPPSRPVVDRLAEEHVLIHDVLEEVDRALVGAGRGRAGRRPPPSWSASRTRSTCSPTCCSRTSSYEERELLHPLARFGMV